MQKHCSDVWKSNLSQENLKLVQEELESARGSTQLLCIAMLSVTRFRKNPDKHYNETHYTTWHQSSSESLSPIHNFWK